jgi:trimeric autotransporter adhesin
MKTAAPLFLIVILVAWFAVPPAAQAITPAPDGGYPGANTAEGTDALFSLTSGIANTAVGFNALHDDTTGGFNVAIGSSALANNTSGSFNMAIGTDALRDNNANFNLAIGFRVGFMNTTGNHLTGIGAAALRNNTTGALNTAIGADAMRDNTIGEQNTAIGADALANNERGGANTAMGTQALFSNITGDVNTAIGYQALPSNTTGGGNTAIGAGALLDATGNNNIAVGDAAGLFVTMGDNNIDIGNNGVAGDFDTIRIGSSVQGAIYLAGIAGQVVGAGGTTCYVDNDGKLGVLLSSRRFKTDIADMGAASETLLALRPVTFRYKPELDKRCTPQFGLVAEEVAKVNPDLVTRDGKGELTTVRYEAVNVMLLNEFLKEHRKVEELQASIAQQRKDFQAAIAQQQKDSQATAAQQERQIETLTAGLQKVTAELAAASPSSGRLGARRPAPQSVVNNQ